MARVPTYGGQQVGRSALPGVRVPNAPRDAFMPEQPIDVSRSAQIIGQIREEQIQRADQIALNDIDNQLAGLAGELRRSGESRRGRDALNATPEAADAWMK